jgi:hypothetical protein
VRFIAVLLLIAISSGVGSFVFGVTLRHFPGPPSPILGVIAGVFILGAGLSLMGGIVDSAVHQQAMIDPGATVREVVDSLGVWSAAAVVLGVSLGLPAGLTVADWSRSLE